MIRGQQLELHSTSQCSLQEWQEVAVPLAPVDDVCGDPTWSHPPTLIRVPTTYDGLITRQRVREIVQGLTEQIILQGNEYSPGETENEDMEQGKI